MSIGAQETRNSVTRRKMNVSRSKLFSSKLQMYTINYALTHTYIYIFIYMYIILYKISLFSLDRLLIHLSVCIPASKHVHIDLIESATVLFTSYLMLSPSLPCQYTHKRIQTHNIREERCDSLTLSRGRVQKYTQTHTHTQLYNTKN